MTEWKEVLVWSPQPGDRIEGRLVRVTRERSRYPITHEGTDDDYVCPVLLLDTGGALVSVRGMTSVLKKRIERLEAKGKLQAGAWVEVAQLGASATYRGPDGIPSIRYRVRARSARPT